MDGRSGVLALSIGAGQVQRLLVDAGSIVVVLHGAVVLRYPFLWLAERLTAPLVSLAQEDALLLESGGWIDLHAEAGAEAVVLAPAGLSLWQRICGLLDSSGAPGRRPGAMRAGAQDELPPCGEESAKEARQCAESVDLSGAYCCAATKKY